jgi:hypothetical protein
MQLGSLRCGISQCTVDHRVGIISVESRIVRCCLDVDAWRSGGGQHRLHSCHCIFGISSRTVNICGAIVAQEIFRNALIAVCAKHGHQVC